MGWLKTVQVMELKVATRVLKLQKGDHYKEKNTEAKTCDARFMSLVGRHMNGTLDDDEFFDAVVAEHNDWDLPKEDDESDSEEDFSED